MATRQLARWATGLNWSAIPQRTQKAAIQSLYNYIGCAMHGSSHPAVGKASAALEPFFASRDCSLLGSRLKTDAQHAALLNGIASHVHDYDDTHLETIIHPCGPVASAILGYAQYRGHVSGRKLLTALIAGIEAECKAGLAVWPTHYDVGWHITSTTGSLGAAVGVAHLMNLDAERMAHALGLAAVQVVGLREMFGSDTKSFHPGRAAQSGLLAALLAEKGYTSSEEALEAKRGWANVVVSGGQPQLDKYFGELGQVWETEKNSFKPFPCGIVKHPAIDAAIQINRILKERSSMIDALKNMNVHCKVHPLVIELTSKPNPKDGLEAKFSVAHGVAVGLIYGRVGPAQYSDEVAREQAVVSLRNCVKAVADGSLRSDEAIVSAFDSDGNKIAEVHVDHAVGSMDRPLADQVLEEKFVDQVALSLGEEAARNASSIAWSIVDTDDVRKSLAAL